MWVDKSLLRAVLYFIPLILAYTPEVCNNACFTYLNEIHQLSPLAAVGQPGSALTIKNIEWMCASYGDDADICARCTSDNTPGGLGQGNKAQELVYAWGYTCQTYKIIGVQQALACWENILESTQDCAV